VTRRATLIGIGLAAFITFWPTYTSQIVYSLRGDYAHLSIGFLIPFVFLLGINHLLQRRGGGLASSELVAISCIGFLVAWMHGEGIPAFFLDVITVPTYFASPENQWREVMLHHIPDWTIVSSLDATTGFYEGLPDGRSIPWRAWISPFFWWGTLFGAVLVVNICVSVIFRKQWMEHERLSFPVATVLLELTGASGTSGTIASLVRSPRFWLGFGVVFGAYAWNAAGWFLTVMPQIPIRMPRNLWIAEGFPPIIFSVHPMTIAFGYFTKSEVLLSIWVFNLLAILQVGLLNRLGVEMGSPDIYCGFHPATAWQGFGGMIVFVGWGAWVGRTHFKSVFQKALGRNDDLDDSEELLSSRTAVWLMLVCGSYIVFLLNRAGLGWAPLLAFVFATAVLYIGLARIMVESGLVYLRGPVTAQAFAWHLFGINGIGPAGGIALALSYTFFCDARTLAMTTMAHIPRLGVAIDRKNRRRLVPTLFASCLIGLSVAICFMLYQGYHATGSYNFGIPRVGLNIWPYTATRIQQIQGPDWTRLQFLGIGAVFTGGLLYLRTLFPGFLIHPLGFTISASAPTRTSASSIFLVWLIKKLLLKLGGLEHYRQMTPVFLGALVGFLMGLTLGAVVDIIWFNGSGHQLNGS